jgi:hypothetical protein
MATGITTPKAADGQKLLVRRSPGPRSWIRPITQSPNRPIAGWTLLGVWFPGIWRPTRPAQPLPASTWGEVPVTKKAFPSLRPEPFRDGGPPFATWLWTGQAFALCLSAKSAFVQHTTCVARIRARLGMERMLRMGKKGLSRGAREPRAKQVQLPPIGASLDEVEARWISGFLDFWISAPLLPDMSGVNQALISKLQSCKAAKR